MTLVVASVPPLRDEPAPRMSGVLSGDVLPVPRADVRLQARLLEAEERCARCWWLGVHGGAGETTLANLFAGIPAADHHWPISDGPRKTSVVLVARTNFCGMVAAQAAMRDWSANYRRHVQVLGLVLIADRPGKLPRPLLDLQRTLAGATPNLWRLPWMESWTLGEIPSRENAPAKEVEALRLGLSAALNAARKERQDG
jgi:hypothetical protein